MKGYSEPTNTTIDGRSAFSEGFHITPVIEDECKVLLSMSGACHDLVQSCGSPLNVILPKRIDRNADLLLETFDHYHLTGKIYCTTKPNRSTAFLRHIAHRLELGVDVSSEGSLAAALSAGVAANRLEATGPKNHRYLTLAILHNIVVNIDDISELERIPEIRRALNIRVRTPILVRLSGFNDSLNSRTESDSTFGVTSHDLPLLFTKLEQLREHVDLRGFAYHINTDSIVHRVAATEQCLLACFEGRSRGFTPNVINLGGGFRIRYAADHQQWSQFLVRLKASLVGTADMCTWNRSGLGFSTDGKVVKGAPRFMDHAEPLSPADQLCNLLRQPLPQFSGIPAAQLLSEALIDVWIEPGRAMLDQVGITLGRILCIRKTERGLPLIVMEMNRTNLNSFELSLLTDPVLIPASTRCTRAPVGYFLTGNLCVSNELLMPRMVYFNQELAPGDILAFCNTAPYIMDFAESKTLHQPLARKVACYFEHTQLHWSMDEEYQPRPRRDQRSQA